MIIALVDDNEAERNKTLPMLLQGFHDCNIPVGRFDFFSSGEEFLKHWKLGSYDLIVLDILMENITGIDVAKEIRKQNNDVRIVFCSDSNEYAAESYNLNASYYLQKPVTEDNVLEMIQRLNVADYEMRQFIVLPNEERLILRNVLYSQYSNHAIEIHMKKGDVKKVWMSQNEFSKLLESHDYFLSCNKGTIVNLHEVEEHNKDEFVMTDGEILPISRRKKKEVEEAYHDFLFHSMRKDLG